MNKMIILYNCLFIFHLYSAEERITIFNSNLPKIGVDIKYTDLTTGKLQASLETNYITSGNNKSFNLINKEKNYKSNFTINLNRFLPSLVKLEDIQAGDTITICLQNRDTVSLRNTRTNGEFICISKKKPIIIGSNPDNFPQSRDLIEHTLTIINKDVFQVEVRHEALRNKYIRDTVSLSPWIDSQRSFLRNQVAQYCGFILQQGEQQTLTTYSSTDPNITKTLTALFIPQSEQIVHVNINEGEINSGDTIEIGLHNNRNQIAIKKITPHGEKILALLYANTLEGLTAVFK